MIAKTNNIRQQITFSTSSIKYASGQCKISRPFIPWADSNCCYYSFQFVKAFDASQRYFFNFWSAFDLFVTNANIQEKNTEKTLFFLNIQAYRQTRQTNEHVMELSHYLFLKPSFVSSQTRVSKYGTHWRIRCGSMI